MDGRVFFTATKSLYFSAEFWAEVLAKPRENLQAGKLPQNSMFRMFPESSGILMMEVLAKLKHLTIREKVEATMLTVASYYTRKLPIT